MKSLQERTLLITASGKSFFDLVGEILQKQALQDVLRNKITTVEQAIELLQHTTSKDNFDLYLAIGTRHDLSTGTQWFNHLVGIYHGTSNSMGFKLPRLVFLPYDPEVSGPLESQNDEDVVIIVELPEPEKPYDESDLCLINPGAKMVASSALEGSYCQTFAVPGLLPMNHHTYGTYVELQLHVAEFIKPYGKGSKNEGINRYAFQNLMSLSEFGLPRDSYEYTASIMSTIKPETWDHTKIPMVFFAPSTLDNFEANKQHEADILRSIVEIMRLYELKVQRLHKPKEKVHHKTPIKASLERWMKTGDQEEAMDLNDFRNWKDCGLEIAQQLPTMSSTGWITCDYPNDDQEGYASQQIIILLGDLVTLIGCTFVCTRVHFP